MAAQTLLLDRSINEDEPTKPISLAEDVIGAAVHYVHLYHGQASIRGSPDCAIWGHVKDWWGWRDTFRNVPSVLPAVRLTADK